ncbi:MAG: CCA tRNA nucleotidyltransferase [Kordiimonadaceae bacterium]|nr:CCA tRNA nucleotidyltransferase [Kordiimonadaceae bacterium]MBT6035072.1 CCA tRNA nucleotidyltransferase [Kordiimonadaceae bacterium]MBT7582087.1 CCA tRNA nucleotidyltransferase [Kordiimonadaceae bacterium]
MNKLELDIGSPEWLDNSDLKNIMSVLNGGGDHAKIVGGTVRDTLINHFWNKTRPVGDIDIASINTPEANTALLEAAGIKVIPTGIKYGTVTAVINKKPYEITTLRRDVSTDGRHAQVEYSDDWACDAKRRDFTINALYMDANGTIFDPLGGIKDVKAGKVRFIGDADVRIKEDALRILRFFRFSSQFDMGGFDETAMLACVALKDMIVDLSGERIWQEFEKILRSKRAIQTIPVLATIGILRQILPDFAKTENFIKYTKLEKKLKLQNAIGRLSCLLPSDKNIIEKSALHLKLSNDQKDNLVKFAASYPKHDLKTKSLRKVLYQYGKAVVIHNLLLLGKLDQKTLNYINNYQMPALPISGQDLLNEGWKPGPELGAELKRREQLWIDGDFK